MLRRLHVPGREVPAWARAIDVIVLALLILAFVVATTGGYRGRPFGLRVLGRVGCVYRLRY